MLTLRPRFVLLSALLLLAPGCASPSGDTPVEKREAVERMREQSLAEFARRSPEGRAEVAGAAGYAVFSNIGATFIIVGGSGGYGVVVDSASGRRTYMKMGGGELGLGLGVKDFRAIFAFRDAEAMRDFVDGRFDFGAQADAAGRIGEKGDSAGAVTDFRERSKVWQFTEQGVMLGATLKGVKFWKDDELNRGGAELGGPR
jgi:lipid-binding SYLF domain-containing protein